jgi:hypothetical protein
MSKTFEEMAQDESGTIYEDGYESGVRYIIMRGPVALCAYLGVPLDHPLANQPYDDIPLRVHGGLTFGEEGKKPWPEGWFWYGWDYGHAGDKAFYYSGDSVWGDLGGKEWTIPEVKDEIWWVALDFKRLMRLVERLGAS